MNEKPKVFTFANHSIAKGNMQIWNININLESYKQCLKILLLKMVHTSSTSIPYVIKSIWWTEA